jgi:putative heme iron utilization protein
MLDQQAVQRIIGHMNDDHGDAVLLYAKAFAGRVNATSAKLVDFDERGMGIACVEGGGETQCRVDFDQPLVDLGDARRVLVALSERARAELGSPTA